MLWVGWFGFNAGSAVSAGGAAGFAMMVTQICAATGGLMWMMMDYMLIGKPSVLGIVKYVPWHTHTHTPRITIVCYFLINLLVIHPLYC
jgi:Amt family ammonium transporter